jgi:RNA polymerase sigma-70 factor, ECF subfamily
MTAFDETYREHLSSVFRYALRCVGRREIAEEITSEAFVELFRRFDQIDQAQLPRWLFTVVRNRATDFWRRDARERRYLSRLDPDPEAAQAEGFQQWLDDVTALKPLHRACLTLRYVHGMERAEIGRRLGLSENQVKGHLQYAHTLLRKGLRETK